MRYESDRQEEYAISCCDTNRCSVAPMTDCFSSEAEAIASWNTRIAHAAPKHERVREALSEVGAPIEGDRRMAIRSAAYALETFSADPPGTFAREALVILNAALCPQARPMLALATPPAPGEDVVLVPRVPTETMWGAGSLARALMMWIDINPRPTPTALFRHLDRTGVSVPQWLRDEPEMAPRCADHVISKATRCVMIYRAMLDAAAPSPAAGEV
jgi:hypothetical protein